MTNSISTPQTLRFLDWPFCFKKFVLCKFLQCHNATLNVYDQYGSKAVHQPTTSKFMQFKSFQFVQPPPSFMSHDILGSSYNPIHFQLLMLMPCSIFTTQSKMFLLLLLLFDNNVFYKFT